LLAFGEDSHPADVHRFAVGTVQPAETQSVLGDVQIDQSAGVTGIGDVPLHPTAGRSVAVPQVGVAKPRRFLAHPIQPRVQRRDELLLGDKITVFGPGQRTHLGLGEDAAPDFRSPTTLSDVHRPPPIAGGRPGRSVRAGGLHG